MPIVQQSAPALFTSPPVYLLPAPPKRLALPAPKVSGYLPAPKSTAGGTMDSPLRDDYRVQAGVHAGTPLQTHQQQRRKRKTAQTAQTVVPEMADSLENLVLNCPNFDDLLEAIGPIRPAAELEAEFGVIQARIEARFQQLYTQLAARSSGAFRSARSSRSPRSGWVAMSEVGDDA